MPPAFTQRQNGAAVSRLLWWKCRNNRLLTTSAKPDSCIRSRCAHRFSAFPIVAGAVDPEAVFPNPGRLNGRRMRALLLLLRHSGLRIGDAVTFPLSISNDKLFLYTSKAWTPAFCRRLQSPHSQRRSSHMRASSSGPETGR